MTLRFVDSFDHYTTAQLSRKYDSVSGVTINSSAGRRSTAGAEFLFARSLTKVMDAQATWIVGFSLKVVAAPTATLAFVTIMDGATEQVSLRIELTTGKFIVSRAGTTLGTSTAALIVGSLDQYIEFKVTINNSTGSYEVRQNGVNVLSGSSVDTQNTANATADRVKLENMTASAVSISQVEDLYICDGQGSKNNNFLGDVRIDYFGPDGAGNSSGMTPSAGSNYQNVDDNPADDDTTYNSSNVASTKDTYTFTDMTHNPVSIYGVQVNMTAKKDDAGTRSICSVVRSGGSDTDGTTQALTTSYTGYRQIIELDPNGSIDWTKTNVNSAEFGAKVAA